MEEDMVDEEKVQPTTLANLSQPLLSLRTKGNNFTRNKVDKTSHHMFSKTRTYEDDETDTVVRTMSPISVYLQQQQQNNSGQLKRKLSSSEESFMSDDSDKNIHEVAKTLKKMRFRCLVTVKTLTGKSIPLELDSSIEVEMIKRLLFEIEGIPVEQQKLVYEGKQISHGSIESCGMHDGCIVYLVLSLPLSRGFSGISSAHRKENGWMMLEKNKIQGNSTSSSFHTNTSNNNVIDNSFHLRIFSLSKNSSKDNENSSNLINSLSSTNSSSNNK